MLQYAYKPQQSPTAAAPEEPDQRWVDYDPIIDRPPLRWPNGARVALWICPCVLDFDYLPPPNAWLESWARMPSPDVMAYGRQEYGNRVGFWRMLEVLDKYRARCTAVINTAALQRYPAITKAIAERGWDILGHGMSNTRFIFGRSAAEELAYYRDMLATVEDLTGVRMRGMGGAGPQVGTDNTPDLLAEAGFLYHSDWFMDDQPFPINVRKGRLISLPYSVEMNDSAVLWSFEADEFLDIAKRQFDRLHREGEASGRVMCVSLHPALIGQPQRIRYLDALLHHLTTAPDVWHATGAEIAEHYLRHAYDAAVARLAARRR